MKINDMLDGKQAVRMVKSPDAYVKQRVQSSADELDRTGEAALHCEILNEALCKLVERLYKTDTDGVHANVDMATGKILIPQPWGNSGHKKWKLRPREAICLRHILMTRVRVNHAKHLFDYSPESRTWFVNVSHYPDADRAMGYLQKRAIVPAEWRTAVGEYKDKRRKND